MKSGLVTMLKSCAVAVSMLVFSGSQNLWAVDSMVLKSLPPELVSAVADQVGPVMINIPGVAAVGAGWCGKGSKMGLGIKVYWQDRVAMDSFLENEITINLGSETLVSIPVCSSFTGKIVPQ